MFKNYSEWLNENVNFSNQETAEFPDFLELLISANDPAEDTSHDWIVSFDETYNTACEMWMVPSGKRSKEHLRKDFASGKYEWCSYTCEFTVPDDDSSSMNYIPVDDERALSYMRKQGWEEYDMDDGSGTHMSAIYRKEASPDLLKRISTGIAEHVKKNSREISSQLASNLSPLMTPSDRESVRAILSSKSLNI